MMLGSKELRVGQSVLEAEYAREAVFQLSYNLAHYWYFEDSCQPQLTQLLADLLGNAN